MNYTCPYGMPDTLHYEKSWNQALTIKNVERKERKL